MLEGVRVMTRLALLVLVATCYVVMSEVLACADSLDYV